MLKPKILNNLAVEKKWILPSHFILPCLNLEPSKDKKLSANKRTVMSVSLTPMN